MESEALDFGMASPARYREACAAAGFAEVEIRDRNPWYREVARAELARMTGPWRHRAAARLGQDFVAHNIETWTRIIAVLDSGEHRPTHIRARKP